MSRKNQLEKKPLTPAVEGTDIWDRNRGETQKAYNAFCIYRDQGLERTLRSTAKHLGKSFTLISRWSIVWNWVRRVNDYEAHLEIQRRRKNEEAIENAQQRHAIVARLMTQKVVQRLQQLEAHEITPSLLSSMAKTAMDMEFDSIGAPKGAQRHELTGAGGKDLMAIPALQVFFDDGEGEDDEDEYS